MVSHTDAICLNVFLELGEVAIAKVAGGKCDARLVNLGIEPCVEMDAMAWDASLLTELYAELFVSIRLRPTQLKVAVASLYLIPQFVEHP